MPQFNVNGPGSPAFILTEEKITAALTYKPGKQEDVEALQKTVATKADSEEVKRTYATKEELESIEAGNIPALDDYAKTKYVDEQLALKATAKSVEDLTSTVSKKAEQSAVDTLTTQVAGKADSTTVESTYAKKSDVASAVRYKESVAKLTDLQEKKATAQLGDMFNVQESDMNYVYNGSDFDALAPMVDLSGYALKTYVDTETAKKANTTHTHQASQVTFSDGEDFQTKLDNGSLKGPKGDTGSPGTNGKDGAPGAAGATGPAGPNTVSTTTTTNISGLLKGNGSTVVQATADTDYLTPNKAANTYLPIGYKITSAKITLSASKWTSSKQTVSVSGVTSDEANQAIFICPAMASIDAYTKAGVICITQGSGSLTFQCSKTPSSDLTVYVNMQKVN